MRILYVVSPYHAVPPVYYGGVERVVAEIANELTANGHSVSLLAHPDSQCPVELIPWQHPEIHTRRGRTSGLLQTLQLVMKTRFDIVHSFTSALISLPLLLTAGAAVLTYQLPIKSRLPDALFRIRPKRLRLSAPGAHMFQGRDSAAWAHIPNCVSLADYRFQPAPPSDAPLVMIGRLAPQKGFHTGIEVALRTGIPLVIAGNIDRDEGSYFEDCIAPHIDNKLITYLGPVNDEQKSALLQTARAFLMPVEWDEPFGIVMIEAMACGVPVVGFNRGAIPEVVEDLTTGFICNSMEDMVAAVMQVSSIDRNRVRARVEARYCSEVVSRMYLALYEALLS